MPKHPSRTAGKVAPLTPSAGTACAYLRCSSDRQAKQEASLPAQRREIERRAELDGKAIVKWFEDDGISGKETTKRDGINELMSYLEKEPVEVLYLYDFRRLARSQEDAYYVRRRCKAMGVKIVALTQPSVENAGANALLQSLYDGIAEMERHYLSEMAKRGMEQALRDGWWPYRQAPYGFRAIGVENARGTRRYKLVPDPEEAETVKLIFSLYVEGDGSKLIASKLDKFGIKPTSRGSIARTRSPVGWKTKAVREVLDNPAYWGAVAWGGEVVNEAHHPGIIDKATWEEAQRLKKARYRVPSDLVGLTLSRSQHGLFRPWLVCGDCGGSVVLSHGGSKDNRVWYYNCASRLRKTQACKGITIVADDLDAQLLEVFKTDILTEDHLRRLIERSIARLKEDGGGELRERRSTLEARIENLSRRLQRLAGAIADGSMDLKDVGPMSKPLREQREQAQAELDSLPEPKPVPNVEDIDIDAFRAGFLKGWEHDDILVRRKALGALVDEIKLLPGQATVYYSWKAGGEVKPLRGPQGGPYGPHTGFELVVMVPGLARPRARQVA